MSAKSTHRSLSVLIGLVIAPGCFSEPETVDDDDGGTTCAGDACTTTGPGPTGSEPTSTSDGTTGLPEDSSDGPGSSDSSTWAFAGAPEWWERRSPSHLRLVVRSGNRSTQLGRPLR